MAYESLRKGLASFIEKALERIIIPEERLKKGQASLKKDLTQARNPPKTSIFQQIGPLTTALSKDRNPLKHLKQG